MDKTDTILVTGATGLVGTHVMLQLLMQGYHVCALKREKSDCSIVKDIFDYYDQSSLFEKIEWRTADVTDIFSLRSAFDNITAVCNAAAMVSFDKKEHKQMWQVNVEGTANIVDVALEVGVKTFCHVSSIGAIGHTTDGSSIDEKTPFQPDEKRSIYSKSKFFQEMEIWKGIENGLNAIIVNPGVIIGPCTPTRSSGLIASTMQKGTSFFTNGSTGYVDVRDVATAIVGLMQKEKYGERYILVGENSTVRNVQNIFADYFGHNRPRYCASKKLLSIVAILCSIISAISGKKNTLTLETVKTMGGMHTYNSKKIEDAIGLKFHTLEQSIANAASFFKQKNI